MGKLSCRRGDKDRDGTRIEEDRSEHRSRDAIREGRRENEALINNTESKAERRQRQREVRQGRKQI